ncbi:MAG: NifU family protein [Candidatus Eremiobacteraeota bacterium]|nr:NifU family protein [Candidatus Eremiobacteraeota bacterium]
MLNKEEVEKIINEQVRPHLVVDGGDIELVEIDGNVVKVKLLGACGTCPMAQLTLQHGVERALKKAIPEVEAVLTV